MSKSVLFAVVSLILSIGFSMPAVAKGKKGGIEPYLSESFPSDELIAKTCKAKADQVMGKIETGPGQYKLYIARITRGVVTADPTVLEKTDKNLWVITCFASRPKALMEPIKK